MSQSKLSQYIAAGENISLQKFAPVFVGPSPLKRRRPLNNNFDEIPEEDYKKLYEECQKKLQDCLSKKHEPIVLSSDSESEDENNDEKTALLRQLSYNPEMAADFLNENGYIVIEIPWMNETRLLKMRKEFDDTLKDFREFKTDAEDYILGGFSALGNPSSFHNMFVRTLRMYAMAEVFYLFKAMIDKMPGDEWKLEQTIDRMLYRLPGKSPSRETFHRDEAISALESDKIFGGWINLNLFSQYFSCVPGTHKGVQGHSGFNKIKDKDAIENYNKKKQSIEIPPGHIMIFYENMVHEVVAKKTTETMYRLFTGWRITESDECLLGNEELLRRLKDNAYLPLKSGQEPPIYSKLHWTNHISMLQAFSDTNVKDKFKELRKMKSTNREHFVAQRHMMSLKEANEQLYPPYSEREINMYIPSKKLSLRYGGNDTFYDLTL